MRRSCWRYLQPCIIDVIVLEYRVLNAQHAIEVISLMAEKPQGAGSIWNPNSWHWEMKNYTEVAKEIVRDKVLLMEIRHEDYVLRHTKVKFNKA